MFKAVQWIVTDTCKWVAAGMAEMDTYTLACGSQRSCQLLTSCQYWQWIKIGSVHLDLIKADQSAAVKATGPFSPMHPWPTAMLELPSWIETVGLSTFHCWWLGSVGVGHTDFFFLLLDLRLNYMLVFHIPIWQKTFRGLPLYTFTT